MQPSPNQNPTALTLAVEGMSCGDLDTKRVKVRGTAVDETAVVSAIDEAVRT